MAKLSFTTPKSNFYSDIIKILNVITGTNWGHKDMSGLCRYVSCELYPVRIGALWGKWYEKKFRIALDIVIENNSPIIFNTRSDWADAVGVELRSKLMVLFANNALISAWRPSCEFMCTVAQHNPVAPVSTYNVYYEDCAD